MRGLKFVAGLAALVALCGCDWGGTGDEGSWNDAYSWVNFTGVYRSPNGGTIVNQNTNEVSKDSSSAATTTSSMAKTTESFKTARSGTWSHPPVAGSVTVTAKGNTTDKFGSQFTLSFSDDGAGHLVASDTTYGRSGTINYSTGTWSVNWEGIQISSVSVSYTYEVQGTAGTSSKSGSNNVMIYSFNVVQAGNKLTITDSNGVVYSGNVTGANVPSDTTQSGSVRLSFEAASGNGVKLVGAFNGDWSGSGTAGQGTLSNRLLEGTYVGKTSASIYAISGSVTLSAPVVASNVPVVDTTTTTTP